MTLEFDQICIDAHDATALGRWWARVPGTPTSPRSRPAGG